MNKIMGHNLIISDSKTVAENIDDRSYLFVDVRPAFGENPETGDIAVRWNILPSLVHYIDTLSRYTDVVIYCSAGMDRSPFVAAVVISEKIGCELDYAYDIVLDNHPMTIRHADWRSDFIRIKRNKDGNKI